MSPDAMALAQLLRDAAQAEVLPRFRRLDEGMVKVKSEAIDLVTEADTAAERFILEGVRRLLPEALFVGEESVAADPGLLGRLAEAPFAVVVDPIDGTANFAAGLPLFGVMAAVVRDGKTVCGIIYDPMGDDWVMAEAGQGAVQRFPDGRDVDLHVAAPLPLAEMVGTVSTAFLPPAKRAEILGNLAQVRLNANYRTAAHEYRLFAGGHSQFMMFNKLMPWDHLAGALISSEAGAHVRRLDGSVYAPHHVGGGLLVAVDEASWTVLRERVFTV